MTFSDWYLHALPAEAFILKLWHKKLNLNFVFQIILIISIHNIVLKSCLHSIMSCDDNLSIYDFKWLLLTCTTNWSIYL